MIGEPVTLPARWRGEAPLAGDYLSTGSRARYAYRIVAIDPITPRSHQGRRFNLRITAIRERPEDVPPFAKVWRWKWDIRRKATPRIRLHT